VFGGLISSVYANAIERDLTLPRAHGQSGNPPQVLPTMLPVAPTTTAQGTGQGQADILAHDTFQRADQALWGTAVDGHKWQSDANTVPIFSIMGGMGQIAGAQGTFNAVLGPVSSNTDVVVSTTADRFDAGTIRITGIKR
jgi:hypothetical protein